MGKPTDIGEFRQAGMWKQTYNGRREIIPTNDGGGEARTAMEDAWVGRK